MACPIKVTDEMKAKWAEEFWTQISSMYSPTKRSIEFKRDLVQKKPEAIEIKFTYEAYGKMMALVRHFNSEIAWHGLVKRHDKTHFEIYDIEVYPQTVTAATVNTDQSKYEMWLMDPDIHPDEKFDDIRMQGHSHVNMSTSPSVTDLSNQERMLQVLKPDDWYIFLIWNKREEHSARVYDLHDNIVYDENDIKFVIEDDEPFLKEAEKMLETVKYKAPAHNTPYYGVYQNGQHTSNYYGGGLPSYTSPPSWVQQATEQSKGAQKVQQKETSPVKSATAAAAPKIPVQSVTIADEDDDDDYGVGLYGYYQKFPGKLNTYGNTSCEVYGEVYADDDYIR